MARLPSRNDGRLFNPKERIMKTNVGKGDRAVRIGGGLALIVMTLTGMVGAWGWIGVVPLLTGVFGYCPAYRLIGLSTCPMDTL